MDPIQAIILGFIQGLTEWLPISSTGHLRIAENLLGLAVPLLFDVALHVGTLAVILIFFRRDIKKILAAVAKRDFKTENGKLVPLIIVGTVPTALIGVFFGDFLDTYFTSFFSLGAMFVAGGFALYFSKFGNERKENITYIDALLIGTTQGLAIIPSLSRSGLTITAALLLGIKREKAYKFSFLLSVPAIVGALFWTLYEQQNALVLAGIGLTEILVGVAAAVAVSFLALKFLWKTLAKKKFHLFALYCLFLGLALLVLSLSGF